jgi:beta-glucosidase
MEGRTYKYFRGGPLYPFGHGLSYSIFDYSNLNLTYDNKEITISVDIKNSGKLAGDEVVQVYAKKLNPQIPQPIKTLVTFTRIKLKKNEEKTIDISFNKKQLQYWDMENQQYKVAPGEYEIEVGPSSSDIKLTTVINIK